MDLRVEQNALVAELTRQRDERLEQGRTHAEPTPLTQDSHAPDMAIGKQASTADRLQLVILGDRVPAIWVDAVPLKRFRHALLDDEDPKADPLENRLIAFPYGQADLECSRCAHG